MKKLFILTIIIIQTSILFAQNQHITKFWGNPSKDENGAQVFEVNNNAFFVSVQRDYNVGNTPSESIVLKLDSNCNIVDSFKINKYNKNGYKYLLYHFFYYNNRIIASGYASDSATLKSQIWLAEFDEDLTILFDTIFVNSDPTARIFNYNTLKTNQNKLLITSQYAPAFHDTTNTLAWLLDSAFNIIKSNEFHTKVGFEGFSVVELPSIQSFHIITQNEITKINSIDLTYDTIVWKVADEWSQWQGVGGSKSVSDSSYIQPRKYPFWDYINNKFVFNTYLYIRDKIGEIKDSILIGDLQKSYDKTSYNNFDFFTIDSIFVTGSNYSPDSSWYSNEDNTIYLWNISINGTINWQKYYSLPAMRFLVSNITKTSDGGCFLVGKAWNWSIYGYDNTDIFFLRVDKNGIISGTQGINKIITQSEILVYPNPVIDNLNFDMGLYKDFQLSVYNQIGQILLQKNFTSGNNSISIKEFKQGIYFYNLQNKNGKVINGKFVKE